MSTFTLDITRDHCPMTFVKAKLQLERMAVGDVLEILLKEGEPLQNVPRTCREQGFKVLEVARVRDDVHKVVVKK
ncbi:MAG: sulfurtransferase TusA family protein [Kiritimatiellae bacterium]|nr:sulfurtransferase TusA family protein [Kiritimatiellia bacterium]